jgi:predicted dinucleotide-binding enzyme
MKIAVFGTGMVGDTIGSKLIDLGHAVMMGSRTANNEKALAFVSKHNGKARGTEMYLPLWLSIYGVTNNGAFNINVVS